jgi:hypothetical protein
VDSFEIEYSNPKTVLNFDRGLKRISKNSCSLLENDIFNQIAVHNINPNSIQKLCKPLNSGTDCFFSIQPVSSHQCIAL